MVSTRHVHTPGKYPNLWHMYFYDNEYFYRISQSGPSPHFSQHHNNSSQREASSLAMLAMAATPGTVSASSRRRGRGRPGAAWQPRSLSVAQLPAAPASVPTPNATTAIGECDAKPPDAVDADLRFERPLDREDTTTHSSEDEILLQPQQQYTPPRRGVLATFLRLALPDTDEDSDEDYSPSDEDADDSSSDVSDAEDAPDTARGLFAPYSGGRTVTDSDSDASSTDVAVDNDRRWWESQREKKRWVARYRKADAAFRRRFGCSIDTPGQPELRRRLRREKKRHRAYTLVLAALVVAYLVQLAMVYSASSWAFSMVSWQPQDAPEHADDGGDVTSPVSMSPNAAEALVPARTSTREVPEYVRTGLQLCASLSRRVVKSQHDVTATGHALRACDIAVKFAPPASIELVEAHVLRGDLRSLLSRFDSAEEDYETAMATVDEVVQIQSALMTRLKQQLQLKAVANRWTQLYKHKSLKELRREAKERVAKLSTGLQEDAAQELNALASDWLQVLKRQKPVLEVITQQRSYTLRRLVYTTQDGASAISEPSDE